MLTYSGCFTRWGWGCSSVGRTSDRHTLRQVRFPGASMDFSPRVNLQCRLSYSVRAPPCAMAWINICAHVKDPVVHVRVRWIMATLTNPACTVGWVARLCRSWLSLGKQPKFPLGEIRVGLYGCKTKQNTRKRQNKSC